MEVKTSVSVIIESATATEATTAIAVGSDGVADSIDDKDSGTASVGGGGACGGGEDATFFNANPPEIAANKPPIAGGEDEGGGDGGGGGRGAAGGLKGPGSGGVEVADGAIT